MKERRLFSVVIPAFNARDTLAAAVDSVIRQSVANACYEILLVDDGSSDGTYTLMERLQSRSDNIRLLRNRDNMGPGATRNKGMDAANGEYVTFVDADDRLRPDALERFTSALHGGRPEIVYADIARINAHGDRLPCRADVRHEITTKNLVEGAVNGRWTFCPVGAVFRKDFLANNTILFPGTFYEDIPFTIHCALKATDIRVIDAALYYWIVTQGSITTSISRQKITDAVAVWENIASLLNNEWVFRKYRHAWEKGVIDFLTLTARRIQQHSVEPKNTVGLLRDRIAASPVFARLNFTQRLLEAASFPMDDGLPPTAKKDDAPAIADAVSGAVVMISHTDGHFRNLAAIARQLNVLGVKTVILDISRSKCFAVSRCISAAELVSYSDIQFYFIAVERMSPVFLNAGAYVVSIDWGKPAEDIVFQARQRGIPVIALYEGINDDNLLHPPQPPRRKPLPYRNAEHLLLPGGYYAPLYAKQTASVVGLPHVRKLLDEPVCFPPTPRAVINVNFTYGILEDSREQFLMSAIRACEDLGLPYVVSQHPADRGDLAGLTPSGQSVYACVKQGTLLISRFSTCVLEALALGKPVIYHNPHGEQYPTFQEDIMGAFEVTTSVESLKSAIRKVLADVAAGVDFRRRAADFLHSRVHVHGDVQPERAAAEIIRGIVERDADNFSRRILHFSGMCGVAGAPVGLSRRHEGIIWRYKAAPLLLKGLVLLLLDRESLKMDVLGIVRGIVGKIAKHFRPRAGRGSGAPAPVARPPVARPTTAG
jgi:glycosyltransferase involved in cell wall biosynthesis